MDIPKLKTIDQVLDKCSIKQKFDIKEGKPYWYKINNKDYLIIDAEKTKICVSDSYNFVFNKVNGDFQRWGEEHEDDPQFSPIGPEIADIEISVNGCPNACPFCYKRNTNESATNMSLETFKQIIDKFPKTLTQIAFGITGIQTNPDFIPMMEYCREIGVIPNFTLSGIDLTDELAEKCASLVGALAVSAYQKDKNICYDTVKKFTDLGISQTNIHLMISKQTLDFVYEVLEDRVTDPRLKDMNAIVFLGVKPKGRAKEGYEPVSVDDYKKLIENCFKKGINFGFDSCSAPKFEAGVNALDLAEPVKKHLIQCSEGCESSLFSAYINTLGEYWHCSFAESEESQEKVNVLNVDEFFGDLWYSEPVKNFRENVFQTTENGCRHCNIFDLEG